MVHPTVRLPTPGASPLGVLIQYWRRARNLSQLALANEANVSPRHIRFVETGRTKPSRAMVLRLADTLGIPLRERNALLLAAGFAPAFRESGLDGPELQPVRAALDAILRQQEPFPAVVMNRYWDIVTSNRAAMTFFTKLLDGRLPSAVNYFSAVTVLGTPQDVTLQELRIESFFPSDESTETAARAMAEVTPPAMPATRTETRPAVS